MPRILLIAATTGYQTRAFTESARSLDVAVTLATDRCHILEDPWRDHAVPIRFEGVEESARVLTALPQRPDGIVAVADRSTNIAALTARMLGMPWHSPEAIGLCRNKNRMRSAFSAAGLPSPDHFSLPVDYDSVEAARQIAYPCVLKPLRLSASRGVIRADNEAEFQAAFARIRRILDMPEIRRLDDAGHRLIQVEEYIPGREFALEGLMTNGALDVLAIFDKPDPLEGPFFEETIYVTPSRTPAAIVDAITGTCRHAVRALGLTHGPVHAEMRVNKQGVFMLEIAGRPIGGLCAQALRFVTPQRPGILTLEELVILHAIGTVPSDLRAASNASGVMMIPVPGAGILEAVTGIEDASAVPLIRDLVITAKRGEKLVPLPEGSSYPGFIFADGPDPAAVESALRKSHAALRFHTLAALPTTG